MFFKRKKPQHSFVHDIRIATPCKANWEAMTGDEKIRFCHQCKLNVYNISEMSLEQAEELIAAKEGRICVRLWRRKDGTLITRDCPVALWKIRKRLIMGYSAGCAVLAAITAWMFGRTDSPPAVMMGDIAPAHEYAAGKILIDQSQQQDVLQQSDPHASQEQQSNEQSSEQQSIEYQSYEPQTGQQNRLGSLHMRLQAEPRWTLGRTRNSSDENSLGR
jgi:hypothetical protein